MRSRSSSGQSGESRQAARPEGKLAGAVFRMRLPAPIAEDAQGLGDVVKRVTSAFGIRPCGGCEQRAQTLNRMFPIEERRRR